MLGLEFQMGLARAWTDAVLGCVTACASASAAAVSRAAEADSPRSESDRPANSNANGRSWYRPPAPQPFEVSWFGLPTAYPMAWGMMAFSPPSSSSMSGVFQPWEAWAALLRSPFMSPLAPPAPWWIRPAAAPAPQAVTRAPQPTFSAYRSDSGHAVAQITFPNDVVAAVAVPAQAMPLDTFFTWPATRH